jgi:hypothetical protein
MTGSWIFLMLTLCLRHRHERWRNKILPLFALLLVPAACLCLGWLAGQSICFLVACWFLPEARWPHTWQRLGTRQDRILRRINFWVVLLAWITSRLRDSALAPRPSAGFALLSGVVALLAFVVALIFLVAPPSFQTASPPLDCFSILFSWLSVLLLPHQPGWLRAKSKAKESN